MSAELLCIAILNIGMPNAEFACEQMEHVVNAADDLNFEPEILVAMIHYESRWNPAAVSGSGACGLTQVVPRWTNPRKTCQQLLFAPTSIYEGTKMLRRWMDRFGRGNLSRALCGYNAGYSCRSQGSRGWRYARKIQRLARRIKAQVRQVEEDGC
jgi:soluble lytic murein transglycosylase-like protein|tara:strand:- start:83 stop:547 length:465 start_codon:yes stop_codon:yes gene_type:complete